MLVTNEGKILMQARFKPVTFGDLKNYCLYRPWSDFTASYQKLYQ